LNENEPVNVDDILHKPYWSFIEMIELAMNKQCNNESDGIHADEDLNLKIDLITDRTEAILCRKIVPVDLEKSDTWHDISKHYMKPIMLYGGIAVGIFMLYYLNYLWNQPSVRQLVLSEGGNADLLQIILTFAKLIGYSALPMLMVSLYKPVKLAVLRLKCNSARGMLKFLMEDADMRGFTKQKYDRESAIDFLDSSYGLNLDQGDSLRTNNDEEEDAVPPKNQKMSKVAKAKHSPRNEAKGKIINFLKQEVPAPCCCYHSQMVRYIVKIADKSDLGISLKFKDGCITIPVLKTMTRNIYKTIDASRIQEKNVVMPECPRHGRN
jgi:hypothetical protein